MARGRRRRPGTSQHQGAGGAKVLQLVQPRQADERKAPKAPAGISAESKKRWADFWESRLADYVDPGADLHRLQRWIKDVDEFEKLRKAYNRQRIVKGSQGQPRLNPIAQRLAQLEGQIKDAESQFGMTPAARLKLGIDLGAGQNGPTTADDLNRMIDDEFQREEATAEEEALRERYADS